MRKKHLWWIIPLTLLLLALVWLGIFYLILHNRSQESRPLVLIQTPVNHETIDVGTDIVLHAVAIQDLGVRKIQLWVDGILVEENSASGQEVNTTMAIAATWIPQLVGEHVIIARAESLNGVSGQSTIVINGVDPLVGRSIVHVVGEGETIEDIAISYGVDVEDITQANDQLGPASPQVGDVLLIQAGSDGYAPPFDSWAGDREGLPESEAEPSEEPPPPAPPEPGSIQMMDINWPLWSIQPPDPIQLQVEVQALQTRESYESLHCYVSLAGNTPLWLPDADNDQSTDETFESRSNGTLWNVARYLAATNATRITWEANTPLPLDIYCVGIAGNGLESVNLGRIWDEVPPDQWGIVQTRRSIGGESQFNLAFLVTYPEKGLDETIPPPYNVRLHENRSTLSWSYDTDIDGFAVFLNNQLQFIVDGSQREVAIPPQWFEVPCNTTFNYTIVAFFENYPDGNYSDPSESVTLTGGEPGDPACPLSIVLTFQVLNTGNIGNLVPASGHFMVQDQGISFDGNSSSADRPDVGLANNSGYIIADLFQASGFMFTPVVLELPYDDPEDPYDSLQVGFEIYDEGNRLACGGDLAVRAEDLTADFVGTITNEYPREDDPELCVVTFGITPIIEGASENPLPNLEVEEISYDFTREFYRVLVRNTGQADWAAQDLVMEIANRQREVIGRYTFPNITIQVNQTLEFQDPHWNWQPILDGCVLLDPDNLVQERIDILAEEHIISRGYYCQPLPDFTITEVVFDRATQNLGVTIRNEGERTPDDTKLLLRIEAESGQMFERIVEVTLDKYESDRKWLELTGDERAGLAYGYTVTVNPDGAIAEEEAGNNNFTVEGSTMLRLSWRQAGAWYCSLARQWWGNMDNHWRFSFNANLVGGSDPQPIASWVYDDLQIDVDDHLESWCSSGYLTDWFEVGGDEELVVSMDATMSMTVFSDRESDGGSEHLTAANDFGGVTIIPMNMDSALYDHYVFTNDVSHAESCGVSTSRVGHDDPYDWLAGMHQWGPYYVDDTYGSGHEDLDPCYWSSTFMLYQAEVP